MLPVGTLTKISLSFLSNVLAREMCRLSEIDRVVSTGKQADDDADDDDDEDTLSDMLV